jgi:N-methylhydantoinase A
VTGLVDQPSIIELEATTVPAEPIAHRRLYAGGEWAENAPVYDGDALRPGQTVVGPAIVQFPFTTLVLRPGDVGGVQPNGDTLVEVAPI